MNIVRLHMVLHLGYVKSVTSCTIRPFIMMFANWFIESTQRAWTWPKVTI